MRYFIIYKPYGMICQFSKEGDKQTLADLDFKFPKDVYPLGRLDTDSEGLLILTNDKKLNHKLLNPSFKHERTYYVQVDGQIHKEALKQLEEGVVIRIKKKDYFTSPAKAESIDEPTLPPRNPPVRYRATIPTSWISLTLTEGKNRQVRHMTAAVKFPTLRLVRYAIEDIQLGEMQSGDIVELSGTELYTKLGMKLRE
ncbi:pseudouridine synthase family protein [Bernardetia litoralis DSM 6794]|uniref:Pseudouridine synthase n=1 Tax=Bernardetia litoralis (strain ATCC 23117 / DSM 6794 / NBRC 15988 / NCIMB 1366 / Fx l1 / Sio-4) TaxID=880071 RepID=I4AGP9_BERLS|nr:pseudouridine synthase [Bernardetia litoralis]AFM03134.1 pseudouridine synthase family protein [Bernardetia litoralis DSM 6794]